jgi:hypothetical protein
MTTDLSPPDPALLRVLADAEGRLAQLFPDASGTRAPGPCECCVSAEALWHGSTIVVHHPLCVNRPGVDE